MLTLHDIFRDLGRCDRRFIKLVGILQFTKPETPEPNGITMVLDVEVRATGVKVCTPDLQQFHFPGKLGVLVIEIDHLDIVEPMLDHSAFANNPTCVPFAHGIGRIL